MQSQDFLLEIGCEELPAKTLKLLVIALANNIEQGLQKAQLTFEHSDSKLATPRRLAVIIKNLAPMQPDRKMVRKGPAVSAAFNADGKPTPALEGFLRSCNTTIDKLSKEETKQGSWFVYEFVEPGAKVKDLLPQIVATAIKQLPIPKLMRWGNSTIEFLRPVHWVVMMYGTDVIPAKILGITTDNKTQGHRFLSSRDITIKSPASYEKHLDGEGKVIVDYDKRQQLISQQIQSLSAKQQGEVVYNQKLLDEVTGLVENPHPLLINFDEGFLQVPQEALMAAMVEHQKCFPVADRNGKLLPCFITIANLMSKDPNEVIAGNARVMRARLADARFFFETDCKLSLESQVEQLKNIVFQAKLGSLYDKTLRITKITEAPSLNLSPEIKDFCKRAAYLCKADLVTQMVGEFPELQGIMGYYYARNNGAAENVAVAIREHYLPRFATDTLPQTIPGSIVAVADRIDTLVGIFGINQPPTGEKDPYGLRRAALGILKIIFAREFPVDSNDYIHIDLISLINIAHQNYDGKLINPNTLTDVHNFLLDRLPAYYQELSIKPDTVNAVLAEEKDDLIDIHARINALHKFRDQPETEALVSANKRISNILKNQPELSNDIIIDLFEEEIEHELNNKKTKIEEFIREQKARKAPVAYNEYLMLLAQLREPIDSFFDGVRVIHEDKNITKNRLALLAELRKLFLVVADFSLLQS